MKIKCNTPSCPCQNLPSHLNSPEDRFIYTDEERKFIWMNIPKCASTSLCATLFPPPRNHQQGSKLAAKFASAFFKFAFVRNPYDRAVSNYAMFTQNQMRINQLDSYKLPGLNPQDLSFREFLTMTSQLDNHHWNPQINFLPFEPDFIGRLENLQEDLDNIYKQINIPKQQLPHTNKTNHKHYREHYNDHTIKMVQEIYKDDLQKFNYNF